MSAPFVENIKAWCAGKTRWWRTFLLLGVVWVCWSELKHPMGGTNLLQEANLLIHEAGHELLAWAGHWWHATGGTLAQCAFPIIAAGELYLVQKDYFAVTLCIGWLAENLFEVASYMADARALSLPGYAALSWQAPDIATSHDWRYLLGNAGLLQYDTQIAGVVRIVGIMLMGVCIVYSVWLLLYMTPQKDTAHKD